jgi:hypothetical protein
MNKKYLKDMNKEELIMVLNENDKLYDTVIELMHETASYFAQEEIDILSKNNTVNDYFIDYYNSNQSYIKINEDKIVEYIDNINDYYDIYGVNTKTIMTLRTLNIMKEDYEKALDNNIWQEYYDYDRIQNEMRQYIKTINSDIIEKISSNFEDNIGSMVDYMIDNMDYLMTDIYIKDNSYIAYSIEPKKEVNYK